MNNQISYACLDRQYLAEKENLKEIFEAVISSGQLILGSKVEEFEDQIAQYCKVKYCIALNSGTDALYLGMLAAGIKRGDEVITAPNSFVASAATIHHLGAKPVFVDVAEDQNINPDLIEAAITPKTTAIMPIHLTGRVANMTKINDIAARHNLIVIEDAAQSFGSRYKGQMSGSFGKVGCFSAHPLKVFNACGDAGFITTNDSAIVDRIKRLRSHGLIDRNKVAEWGYVSRLDSLQASILLMRLAKINDYIERRRINAELFRKILNPHHVYIAPCKEDEYNTFQTLVIQVDQRDNLQKYLAQNGVESSIHYPVPIHLQEPSKMYGYKEGDFEKAEIQATRILSLPVSQFLRDEEIIYIGELINAFYK